MGQSLESVLLFERFEVGEKIKDCLKKEKVIHSYIL